MTSSVGSTRRGVPGAPLRPTWWEAANSPSPTMSACSSSCWTNAVSVTAWFTSTTAPGREEPVTLPRRLRRGC